LHGIKVPKKRRLHREKYLEQRKKECFLSKEHEAKMLKMEQAKLKKDIKDIKAILKSLQPLNKPKKIQVCNCCGIDHKICEEHLCFFLTREAVKDAYESTLYFLQNKKIDETPKAIKVVIGLCQILRFFV
jgi:phage gp36-like protein